MLIGGNVIFLQSFRCTLRNESNRHYKIALHTDRTFTSEMERLIKLFLTKHQWSPEQIVGHCKNKAIPMVSVERIYQFIREDKECDGSL